MKILIINISNIGDIVSSLVIVDFLKKKYSKVDFYTLKQFRSLLENEIDINIKNLETIQNINYDIVFDLTSSKNSRKILKNINSNKIYGYHKSLIHKIIYSKYYHKTYPKNKFNNITKNFFPILNDFISDNYNELNLPKLTCKPIKNKNLIGIHLGARNPIRAIPINLIKDIINYFIDQNYEIIIFGDDKNNIKYIELNYTSKVSVFKGDLQELKNLIGSLQLFIGPDSGPLHIAAALNIKSIGIYGPNLFSISGPLNKVIKYVELNYDCRPCNQNNKCLFDIKCLKNISFNKDIKPLIDEYNINCKK